ncbi:MAG: phosphoribosylformylglycinamidine synthase subunit PurL [Pseudomonadota bacterium]
MSLRTEALTQGLTPEEFDRIVSGLGREPNHVELGIFAVMWSEHCCYKSSRIHLRTIPTKGTRVLQGPGENAGLIDAGDGWVVAFKIESHNHPSYIEPYQGAATGVGGILRDIFTMGARPIAMLDSLHFGEPNHPKTPFLFHGVVGGVGGYGNCMGIPTVAGELIFDRSYNGNNLVNAMCVGVARREMIHRGTAKGEGNSVVYLGSKTGRDGIHGATMASEEFGAGNEERRPTVQVGDPFTEKLVMEASLEIMRKGLVVGIQDMGAAGITCSTFEMSGRGNSGMRIDLDKVPLRDPKMTPYEIFLSESQERMLLVAEPKNVPAIREIAAKWEIDCEEIGRVISENKVVATYRGEEVVNLPVRPVTDEAPEYDRPWTAPEPLQATIKERELADLNLERSFRTLFGSPNLASRRAVYEQYDQTVGTDTVLVPGGDAALLRVKGTKLGIAMKADSNAFFCQADPYRGIQHVVAECVRNLAAVGARATAVTNCLNFGNPEDPVVMGQFRETIRGISEACRHFETPITGGNVSFYNQTAEVQIKPTPTIGMIGLMEDSSRYVRSFFQRSGNIVALLGPNAPAALYQSEFARTILRREDLACPPVDLGNEKRLQATLLELAAKNQIRSAHDCSHGGLIQTVAESCLGDRKFGAKIRIPSGVDPALFLFAEEGGRAVVSFDASVRREIEEIARRNSVPMTILGETTGRADLELEGIFRIPLAELENISERFLREL